MIDKLTISLAFFKRLVLTVKQIARVVKDVGLRRASLALVRSSPSDLRRIIDHLRFRARPPTAENILESCGDFVHGFEAREGDPLVLVELKTGEKFAVRRHNLANDLYLLKETFVYRDYAGVSVCDKVVIDVGSNIGDTAVFFGRQGAFVYGYEPSRELFEIAKRNVTLNNVPARLFNVGVGDRRAKIPLPRLDAELNAGDQVRGGLAEPPHVRPGARFEEINIVPFSEIVAQFESIDLVKMDCEGCEFPALLSLDSEGFRKIDHLVLEFHGNPGSLTQKLVEEGFAVRNVAARDPRLGLIFADHVKTNGVNASER